MLESVQPDPKRNPGLSVTWGPPIIDTSPRSRGATPIPPVRSVESVTLHGGTFEPNRQHELLATGKIDNSDVDVLSLIAGGVGSPKIDQLLFASTRNYGALSRMRLLQLRRETGVDITPGLVGTSFNDHLLEITNPLPDVPPIRSLDLSVIDAAATDHDQAETVSLLGLNDISDVRAARHRTFSAWEVPNICSAIALRQLAETIPLKES